MRDIGIVVPAYNVEQYIVRCLDSIKNQTYRDFKCVIVDDGSKDNTLDICRNYAKHDSRFYVLAQTNKGISSARNAALDYINEHLNCEYIAFVDSDDWIHPQMYEILYDILNHYKANMSVCSYKDVVREIDEIQGNLKTEAMNHSTLLGRKEALEHLFTTGNDMFGLVMPKLYKSYLFKNRRFKKGIIYEDVQSAYKVLYEAEKISVTSVSLYNYFYNASSVTKSKYTKKRLDIIPAMEEQIEDLKKWKYQRAYELAVRKYIYLLTYHGKLCHENLNDDKIDRMIRKKLVKLFLKEIKRCHITPMNSPDCYNTLFPGIMHIYWYIYAIGVKLKRRKRNDT